MCVYLSLLSDSDRERTSWHSGVNIAKRLHISRHAVVNALRELEVQRLLKKRIKGRRGPLKLYEYILSPQSAKPKKCLQPVNHSPRSCSPDEQ
jgi:DNA-binding MarR family transcriptional regulator